MDYLITFYKDEAAKIIGETEIVHVNGDDIDAAYSIADELGASLDWAVVWSVEAA